MHKIEHFGESRENEKATYDEHVQNLEAEVERLTRERNDETLKAQGQVEFLRKEAEMQREKLEASDRQIQMTKEEHNTVSYKLQTVEETSDKQLQLLQRLHAEIAPERPTPDDLVELTEVVASHASDLVARLQDTESETTVVKSNLEQALNSGKELRTEIAQTKEILAKEEMSAMHLRENLSEEKTKVTALEGELNQGREQLSSLRAQISAGETGSETLQKKLEAAEKKTSELAEELASRQSRVGSLEEEVHLFQGKLESLQGKLSTSTTHHEARDERTKDLTQRLYSQTERLTRLLERVGYSVTRNGGEMSVAKIPRSERQPQNPNDSSDPGSSIKRSVHLSKTMNDSSDLELLYWMHNNDAPAEAAKYESFLDTLGSFNMDLFAETMYHRIKEAEHKARKWQREAKTYRDRAHIQQKDAHEKIAFRHFKEGDLALFLPTRNQQAGAWAAFNVGFPHFFLREHESHRLRHREWLVARITRIQERVVDLSKSLTTGNEVDSINDEEHENPFQLSDGLRWYLIDAQEDKPGAPTTPGMGKSTVAANTVAATANIQSQPIGVKGKNRDSITSIEGINKTLSKSLESRRSSSTSKRAMPFSIAGGTALLKSSALASETDSLRAAAPETPLASSPLQNATAFTAEAGPSSPGDGKGSDAQAEPSAQREATRTAEVRSIDSLFGP